MSFSSNKSQALPQTAHARLTAALAVSLLFHALLVATFEQLYGERWRLASSHRREAPLRVTLRAPEPPLHQAIEAPAASVPRATESAAIPGRRYYATRDLDVRPGIKTHTEPEYPEAAARRSLSGKVLIELYLDETGAVERVAILRADPPGVFEASVKRAFSAARFTPGMKEGRAVPVQMTVEVEFETPRPEAAQR